MGVVEVYGPTMIAGGSMVEGCGTQIWYDAVKKIIMLKGALHPVGNSVSLTFFEKFTQSWLSAYQKFLNASYNELA